MAFEPVFEPGEQVSDDISLAISGKLALRLVLTNRAVYWPGSKFGITDGVSTEKVPLSEVRRVATRTRNQLGSLVVGLVMVLGGFAWTLVGYVGAPQALIVGGLIVALLGGRRRTVLIEGEQRRFSWSEPITFGGGVKERVSGVIGRIREWADINGLNLEG